uniref:Major facilitator superfamily (MFS) profile domain-containing protein n=1 Tax=Panagrolaimus sp. PS1159 TaxID=55785 RepID=A0AC35G8U5_9BILA
MTVVCIVTHTEEPNITYSAEMQISELSLRGHDNTLGWNAKDIALLLSATFYGGLLTAFWSGYLSDRFAPKFVILFGVIGCVIVTGFTPLLAESNFLALFIARVVMGLGEDFINPAQASFINRWYTPVEMTTVGSFTLTGKALAGTVGFPVSSRLCQMQDYGGWKLAFYIFSGFGGIWVIIWFLYASNIPSHHKYISKEEESHIQTELKELDLNHNPKTIKLYYGSVPWKAICTSRAIFINLICQFTFCFSEAILSAYLPTYLSQVMRVSLNMNGFLAMLTCIIQLIFQVIFGILTDYNLKKGYYSPTTACKIFQTIENILCALAYFGLGFMVNKNSVVLGVMFLILNGIGIAASVSGFMSSQPSLAPQYAGIVSSVLRIAAALGALAAINVVNFVNKGGTDEQWRLIWTIAAGLNLVTVVIFLSAGTAETQDWAKNEPPKHLMKDKKELICIEKASAV